MALKGTTSQQVIREKRYRIEFKKRPMKVKRCQKYGLKEECKQRTREPCKIIKSSRLKLNSGLRENLTWRAREFHVKERLLSDHTDGQALAWSHEQFIINASLITIRMLSFGLCRWLRCTLTGLRCTECFVGKTLGTQHVMFI